MSRPPWSRIWRWHWPKATVPRCCRTFVICLIAVFISVMWGRGAAAAGETMCCQTCLVWRHPSADWSDMMYLIPPLSIVLYRYSIYMQVLCIYIYIHVYVIYVFFKYLSSISCLVCVGAKQLKHLLTSLPDNCWWTSWRKRKQSGDLSWPTLSHPVIFGIPQL